MPQPCSCSITDFFGEIAGVLQRAAGRDGKPYLAKFEDPQVLSAWLYTAAKNRCWQGRRTATYQRSVALEQLLPDDRELQTLPADARANPEDEAGGTPQKRYVIDFA